MSPATPTVEDCLVQIDKAMTGARAGWDGVVIWFEPWLVTRSKRARKVASRHATKAQAVAWAEASLANGWRIVEGPREHLVALGFGEALSMFASAALALGLSFEIRGSGSGDGYGYGDGHGYGDGSGDGDGHGYGDGDGDGYGYGDGHGSGDGYGYGHGSGDGYGYGDGSGDGHGYGDGDGDGYGYGYGHGYGYGSGSGSGSGYGYGEIYIVKGQWNVNKIDKTKPMLVRHHKAGVYVGYYQGDGMIPNTHRFWARHIWNWQARLGTTAIADAGPGPRSSLGPWVMIDLPREELVSTIAATPKCMESVEGFAVSLERMAA
jgi:hypothetical protein